MLVKTNESQTAVVKFPYSIAELRADNPGVSFPAIVDAEILADFNVFNVAPTAPPPYDDITQQLSQADPLKVSSVWTQQWLVTAVSGEQASGNLADYKARSVLKIDADVDAIYAAALGNRGPEYTDAEAAAVAYQAAGYTGTVPADVQSWATAKGWTATQAADDILTAAAQLRGAKSAIRAARLVRKEQVRGAATAADARAAMAAWAVFVAAIKAQLGV